MLKANLWNLKKENMTFGSYIKPIKSTWLAILVVILTTKLKNDHPGEGRNHFPWLNAYDESSKSKKKHLRKVLENLKEHQLYIESASVYFGLRSYFPRYNVPRPTAPRFIKK